MLLILLKAKLNEVAHLFCGSPIDISKFSMDNSCLQAIKSLRSNKAIQITKPDKGPGVVILNKSDYVNKMECIFLDISKFKLLGPVSEFHKTEKNETKLQRHLLKFVKTDELPQNVYQVIRPTGSQRPRMYGLPKIHKQNAPCRPILFLIGSAQHELAKFLAALLQPVLNYYSINCIQDSFTFAERIQKLSVNPNKCFLCSYHICSLFTNVPLAKTIEICSQALYNGDLPEPIIPKHVFTDLMKIATSSVEFSFNNFMNRQIDGVAMGSPPGPALVNTFVRFYESKLNVPVKVKLQNKDKYVTTQALLNSGSTNSFIAEDLIRHEINETPIVDVITQTIQSAPEKRKAQLITHCLLALSTYLNQSQ